MTDEERAVWERRCMRFQETLAGNPPPSLEARLGWLEADASAQRTAILNLERMVERLRIGGVILAAVAGWLLGRSFT